MCEVTFPLLSSALLCCLLLYWVLNFGIPQSFYLQFLLLCLIVLDLLPHFSKYIWNVFILYSPNLCCSAQRKYQPISSSHQLTTQSINVWDHLWAMFVPVRSFILRPTGLFFFSFYWHPPVLLVLLSRLSQCQCDMYLLFCLFRGIYKQNILQIKAIEVILTVCKYVLIVCRGWHLPVSLTAVTHRNNDGLHITVLWWFFASYPNGFSLKVFWALELGFSLSNF